MSRTGSPAPQGGQGECWSAASTVPGEFAVADKRITEDEAISQLSSGMTIGIGGWGSRRKPMSLVRAILRSDLDDLTVVSYGGPDVGLLCAAGKVKRVVFGFVSLDSIPLDPFFRAARQEGRVEATELDEGMLQWGLYAAALRLPFLPTRAGLGSGVMDVNPWLRTVTSPYADGEELVAMPAITLDAALVHVNCADVRGNGQILGIDPYFDNLYLMAAERRFMSATRLVSTDDFSRYGPPQTLVVNRMMVDGVIEAPLGAHFTSCEPDYGRDEAFQSMYAGTARDPDEWEKFRTTYLEVDSEHQYRQAVEATAAEVAAGAIR